MSNLPMQVSVAMNTKVNTACVAAHDWPIIDQSNMLTDRAHAAQFRTYVCIHF